MGIELIANFMTVKGNLFSASDNYSLAPATVTIGSALVLTQSTISCLSFNIT